MSTLTLHRYDGPFAAEAEWVEIEADLVDAIRQVLNLELRHGEIRGRLWGLAEKELHDDHARPKKLLATQTKARRRRKAAQDKRRAMLRGGEEW